MLNSEERKSSSEAILKRGFQGMIDFKRQNIYNR